MTNDNNNGSNEKRKYSENDNFKSEEETESGVDRSGTSSGEGTGLVDSTKPPPRRSARLMSKSDAQEVEEEEGSRNIRSRVDDQGTLNNSASTSASIDSDTGSTRSTRTTSATSARAITASASNLPPIFQTGNLPMFSFSIGISQSPNLNLSSLTSNNSNNNNPAATPFSTSFFTNPQDLPNDIQWIFNSSSNSTAGNEADFLQNMMNSNDLRTSVSGMSGGMIIPLAFRTSTASTSTTGADNVLGSDELLQFARQMFQIISNQPVSTSTNTTNTTNTTTTTELPAALESLLNDFFSRIFNQQPNTPAGLTDEQISALPIIEIGSAGAGDDENEFEIDCAICRECTRVEGEKCVKLGCKHCFHFGCISPWLKRVPSCPICRKVVE